jgi:hypothetical protein
MKGKTTFLPGLLGYCYCLSMGKDLRDKRAAEGLYDNIYSAISGKDGDVSAAAAAALASDLPEQVRTSRDAPAAGSGNQLPRAGKQQQQRKVVVVEGFPSGLPEGTPEGVKIALASARTCRLTVQLHVTVSHLCILSVPPDQMPPIPGEAGTDYPVFASVPETGFACSGQSHLPGIYGDTAANCQVFYMCQADGNSNSFLCPNGTVFNQQYFICDWWYNVDCSATQNFYSLNEFLYKDQPEGKKCTSLFCSAD